MTLISMLIALIIERLAVRSEGWQFVTYFRHFLQWSKKTPLATLSRHPYGVILWWLLPAIVLQLLLLAVNFWLLELLLSTVVLLLCIGSWHYRQSYKQYLNAAGRQDQEAAFLTMQQMASDQGIDNHQGIDNQELSHGQQLVWLNFKYYAAVLFWYALLGAFGAVAYACLRQMAEPKTYQAANEPTIIRADENTEQSDSENQAAATSASPEFSQASQDANTIDDELTQSWQRFAADVSHWADWLPVRLFSFGLALVGHFSRASGVLLSYLGDSSTHGAQVYTQVAKAAEPLPEDVQNCSDESCSLVQLAKRNILFFLAFVAILTLSGWLS